MWDLFPDQELNWGPLSWEHRVFTTRSPGKSRCEQFLKPSREFWSRESWESHCRKEVPNFTGHLGTKFASSPQDCCWASLRARVVVGVLLLPYLLWWGPAQHRSEPIHRPSGREQGKTRVEKSAVDGHTLPDLKIPTCFSSPSLEETSCSLGEDGPLGGDGVEDHLLCLHIHSGPLGGDGVLDHLLCLHIHSGPLGGDGVEEHLLCLVIHSDSSGES